MILLDKSFLTVSVWLASQVLEVMMSAWQHCRRDEGWRVRRGEVRTVQTADTKEGEREEELETPGKYCPPSSLTLL